MNRLFLTLLLLFVSSKFIEGREEIKESVSCIGCQAAVIAFRYIYASNATRDAIINLASYICRNFIHTDSVVCYGMATQFREEIIYVVNELLHRPKQLCSMFLDGCGIHGSAYGDWSIPIPPPPREPKYPLYSRIRSQNLRVLQISDIHFDFNYTEGSVANCKSPICCQKDSKLDGTTKIAAGYWGTLAACDVPYRTVISMLQHINKTEKIDYVYLTGDFMSHLDWSYTRPGHISILRNLSSLLESYFPKIPIFWALGNHEGVPVDSFAPHFIPSMYRPQWLYKEMAMAQRAWIGKKAFQSIKYRGSYCVQLMKGLRVISLNTGYCETVNFWLYINQTDPDGTMSWFTNQLFLAETEQQYVHVLAHIPPGTNECLEGWAKNYYRIVNRFSKTIVGQFFGHVHVDTFTVFYENMNDDASIPTSVLYASPSVTTFRGLNPAFRIYEIDAGNRFNVLDFQTFFFNLTNSEKMVTPKWELLYTAKQEFGLKDLSASSWSRLIDEITINKDTYEKFLRVYVRRSNYECDAKCQFEMLCSLRSGHHNATLCSHIISRKFSFCNYPFKKEANSNANSVENSEKFSKDAKNAIWKTFFEVL